MLTKFLDFDKIYNFCFNEKIVTQKNLSLQAFVIATLENSFGRSTLVYRPVQPNLDFQSTYAFIKKSTILAQ